ncbi:MAG: bifunctional methylenetetrahydrofolate dehydrogenase/methenyltetrahydrofolate cyclohydrolase FolD [Methylococcales bacterium]
MTAQIIDGKAIAIKVREEWKHRVSKLKDKGIRPGLAVIIIGDNPASQVYVRNKVKACHEIGIYSELHDLPGDISEELLLEKIRDLNVNSSINGILVQLPLPSHINVDNVLETIAVEKDVDGFHLYNLGGLISGNTVFPPCTPYGIQCLLEHSNIPLEGQNAVIVGRSNIVGKPMALMLLQKNATVSICTSKTRDLKQFTSLADILIVAAGKPNLITADMVKPGATVIDVGINRLPDGRITGDVDFEGVKEVAGHITPVPGGVGPMTITMLLTNTVIAAERATAFQ